MTGLPNPIDVCCTTCTWCVAGLGSMSAPITLQRGTGVRWGLSEQLPSGDVPPPNILPACGIGLAVEQAAKIREQRLTSPSFPVLVRKILVP
jgi:hypothetical protein